MEPLDDLLIKRRRGTLVAAERRRLESARRASPEYDLVLLAQDVFDHDGAPQPADAERLRELVQAIERRLPPPPRASAPWRGLLRRLAPPLLLAGAAAASIGELAPRSQPAAPTTSAQPSSPLQPSPAQPSPAQPSPAQPSPAEPHPPELAPPPAQSSRLRLRHEPSRPEIPRPPSQPEPARPAPVARPLALPSTPAAEPVATAPDPGPAQSLFRRANRLRPVDWPAAAALYVELVRRYPSSNEAGVAEVALGKWSLAQGRSGDALEWFRAHLRRAPGALTAEALFGEARALESIGSDGEARGPWRRLLELYPTSPYANVARRRLAP
jgi:TolA-binding protein